MEVIDQSPGSAAVQISEVEAKLLSLAVEYWESSMGTGSPLVADLSDRLRDITRDFDALIDNRTES